MFEALTATLPVFSQRANFDLLPKPQTIYDFGKGGEEIASDLRELLPGCGKQRPVAGMLP